MTLFTIAFSACSGEPAVFVPEWEPADAPPALVELNDEVAALSLRLDSPLSPVITVDQFGSFDAIDDTFDGVHPTPSGEAKIAKKWVVALRPLLDTHTGSPPKVLLLGDSITDNHFRPLLWRLLRQDGYQFDFVGSQNSYPLRVDVNDLTDDDDPFDTDHEGHTGWTANELLIGSEWDPAGGGGLSDWLTGYTPDIVALHIGTNDLIIGSLSPQEIATDIAEVVDRLRQANPEVAVLVAQIIPYLPLQEPTE